MKPAEEPIFPGNRDDFSVPIKEMLARRVGHLCSNPGCRQSTSGPQENPAKAINIGVAAHISAAAAGGPRHDPSLSPADRASIDNGIWLCQSCGKLVDNDLLQYSSVILRDWKMASERHAAYRLEHRMAPNGQDVKFQKVERLMPALMAEMRKDMADFPLCREMVVLSRQVSFWYPSDRRMFTYYTDDHADLLSKLMILQNLGLVRDIRHNDVPRFAFDEEFAEYLTLQ